MSKYDKYYEAENFMLDMVRTELIGPVSSEEVLDASPLNTYVCGILWAQPLKGRKDYGDDEADCLTSCELVDSSDTQVDDDEKESAVPVETVLDDDADDVIAKASKRKPSTIGISVVIDANTTIVEATLSFAKYEHFEEQRTYGKEGKSRIYHMYRRKPYSVTMLFDFAKEGIIYHSDKNELLKELGISVVATRRTGHIGIERLVTFSVTNELRSQVTDIVLNESAIFQCEFAIKAKNGQFMPLKPSYSSIYDIEDEMIAMQYRKKYNYAQGHGCATRVSVENNICKEVYSEFIPISEVLQMKPSEIEDKQLFSLEYLYSGNKEEILTRLSAFIDKYQEWYNEQETLSKDAEFDKYRRAVDKCFENIRECIARLRSGIDCLKNDKLAWQSFVLTNKSMYKQRVSMALIKGKISRAEDFKSQQEPPSWYPFQLFYLLMIIPDIVNNDSKYRDVVDLLWFPTGGGKTEAYLGVSAFTIFYERLSEKRSTYGTTVIMRYTLRLLTIQQFERASALICACESVRVQEKLGGSEISIGLWIGIDSAPNTIAKASEAISKLMKGEALYDISSPVQINKCPICGRELTAADYKIVGDHMQIVCENCGRLPIYVVDDDIYHYMPTLIISTVDKFARIVWEERTGRLFGCNVETNKPKLIIQDELHLISGPLGTITGLYESAVDKLCQDAQGYKPKIISSTATVKNAAYQIKGLYGRKHFQFPPAGLNYDDSFFAVQANKSQKPARTYVGLSEQGGSMVDLMIRVYSVLSLADYFLEAKGEDIDVVDQYYTIIGYFNAIKELGTASTVIRERMRSYISSLINGKFKELAEKIGLEKGGSADDDDEGDVQSNKFVFKWRLMNGELTSRKKSDEVRSILKRLENCHTKDQNENLAYKYVLSSNMFSTGVDIDRLGLMVVYGQPKSNSDYIQATSRVGRTNPGLVFSMFNAFRSRDKSYYERFTHYHSSFYRYVESTSVTPFSDRSIEKGLHSVFIALVRHLVPGMEKNDDAKKFTDANSVVKEIYEYILNRVKFIQPDAYPYAKNYLDEVISLWANNAGKSLVYDNKKKGRNASSYMSLLQSAEDEPDGLPVLNSVRNVENSSNIYIEI